jgi:hypothetical protein
VNPRAGARGRVVGMEAREMVVELLEHYKTLAKIPPMPDLRFYPHNLLLFYLPSFPIDLSEDDAVEFVFNRLGICVDKETAFKVIQELEAVYEILDEESRDNYNIFLSIYLNELPRYDLEYDIMEVKELI